ncbi:hypothetical protein EJB05_35147 [Eragrostis curvula]|uniref:Uncharacterized protein n=1 Tax=Eragrostis curvula TaxID=38414 RepID=A0A5J9U5M7_9POAL|nr:hypothetical protein EJB05_35147 [Eragrostis curvula]
MEKPFLLLLQWLLLASHSVTALRFTVDDFPDGFAFGAGTAAFQYEGAVAEDGKSQSIWDTFAHSARNPNERTSDIASDGYHKDDFATFADVCFREFGDRVKHWTTILEPNIIAQGSYDIGIMAPSRCSSPFGHNCTVGNSSVEPYLFLHHNLLAHSSAVRLYREKYQAAQKGVVGINLFSLAIYPLTGSPEDIKATERANDFLFGCLTFPFQGHDNASANKFLNCSILHPLLFGDYPESMKKAACPRLPSFSNYESKLVTGAFDFIGLNHYSSVYASSNPDVSKMAVRDQAADVGALFRDTRDGPTSIQYPAGRMIDPQGLEHVLRYLRGKYGNISIYIQENGCGQTDDSLMDEQRIDFLKKYMASILKSIR